MRRLDAGLHGSCKQPFLDGLVTGAGVQESSLA
jgi:hypothetical protein